MNPTVMPRPPIQNYTPSGGTPSVEWNNNPDGNLFDGAGWLPQEPDIRVTPSRSQQNQLDIQPPSEIQHNCGVQPVQPPTTIPCGRKRKAQPSTPSEDLSKYIKVEGKKNKIIIPWETDNHELADFKSDTMVILGVDKSLFTYTNNLEELGSLTWKVAIKNGGAWAGSSNQVLKLGNSSFKDLFDSGSLFAEIKTITSFQATTSQEPPTTVGASSGAMFHENIQKIFKIQDACEQSSHLHEKPIHINPANLEEYFVITMIKADAWVRAMVSCCINLFFRANPKEVTLTTPPKSFKYHTGPVGRNKGDDDNASDSTGPAQSFISTSSGKYNCFLCHAAGSTGLSGPVYSAAILINSTTAISWILGYVSFPKILSVQCNQLTRLLQFLSNLSAPTPSDHGAPINDFIKFSGLNRASSNVLDGLNELCVNHCLLLQHVTIEEFISFNILVAQSRALMLAFKRYSHHLKKQAKRNSEKTSQFISTHILASALFYFVLQMAFKLLVLNALLSLEGLS
ncbi:hypothetical protein VP01_1984g2 [Puccinia sorghi]|uniref:Uncharacterized protein n=1 Tax=Puccinia sorghi TaxID=27349 RepID=A0A0L6VBP4_9BASI|nr:hypothetical protein VP01_1984g2 [Puccinia sorghi]